jgi:hypothetical protein
MTGKIVKSSLYSYPSCVHLRQYGLSSNAIWHRLQKLAGAETKVRGLEYITILSVIYILQLVGPILHFSSGKSWQIARAPFLDRS